MKHFFIFCSGASRELIKRCPTERSKYTGIGGTVFFTGIFAMLSSAYALYTIFDSFLIALFFSFVWGAMIFNLDRFIVSGLKKTGNIWKELLFASPRFILAIILAIVISKPLELKIFEKEINRKLDEKKTALLLSTKNAVRFTFTETAELNKRKEDLKKEVREKELFRDKLQKEYDAERFGVKTNQSTGLAGIGTNAKKKEQQLDEAQKDFSETQSRNNKKLDELDNRLHDVENSIQKEITAQKVSIDKYDGFAARIDALAALSTESSSISIAVLFITFLFIIIEICPVMVKLMSARGPYDDLLEAHEQSFISYRKEKVEKLNRRTEKRLQMYARQNEYI
jgi:hypothetical protein